MQAKYILIVVGVIAVIAIASWLRSRSVSSPVSSSPQQVSLAELANGERHIYGLLREVQGHAILTESFIREAGDVKPQLTLNTNRPKLSSLNINLSSLARKQKN